MIRNLWNFIPFSKNVDYHKKFLKFLSFLQKTWTFICNFWNFFPFSKNVDHYMHFLECLSKNVDYDKQSMEFISLLQKHGLSYAISKIAFPSPKTWTIRCNFWNFFPSPKTWTILWNLRNFFPHLQKCGLSYAFS